MTDDEIDYRDSLAYRKLRGEILTSEEEKMLLELNIRIDKFFPPRPGLPLEIKALIKEILETKKDGDV